MSNTKQKTVNYKEVDTRVAKGTADAKKMSWQKRSQVITGWAFMAPFVILFTVVFSVPVLVSLYSSFFRLRTVGGEPYDGEGIQSIFVGLENYQHTVASLELWKSIGWVVLYTCFQVPVMILMVLVPALLLDFFLTRHVTTYRLEYFLPSAIPRVVTIMTWLHLYNLGISLSVQRLHAIGLPVDFFNKNVILASMVNMTTWTHTGHNMLIFLAALQVIPAKLPEAVHIDRAGGLQIVTRIKVPMLHGAVLLAVLLSIVGTIQLFDEPQAVSSVLPWMGKSHIPTMMAYDTIVGTPTSSGGGPGSTVAIVMVLIAGVLAVGYFLVDRKMGGND